MKYVIRVPRNITYAMVRVVYEEASKLGIFSHPLYERYYRLPEFTKLNWDYLGHSPTTDTVCGWGTDSKAYAEHDYIIDLRDILDEQV